MIFSERFTQKISDKMRQDIPYIPYGDESGWKRRFEITIPILLLILVFFVLSWKLGWLAGIPFIGQWFGGEKVMNILVVGDDSEITKSLDEIRTAVSLNYQVVDGTDINNIRDPNYLSSYDIIILTESIGSDATYLPTIFRDYLSQYLSGNGKLLLFGVAGSRDPAELSTDGWVQHGMDSYVPVKCRTAFCDSSLVPDGSKDEHAYDQVTMKISDINHPILREFVTTVDFSAGATVEYTITNADVTPISMIEVVVGAQTLSYPGIVVDSFGLGGKVVYFAYHPSRTPTVFKNAIEYLRG